MLVCVFGATLARVAGQMLLGQGSDSPERGLLMLATGAMSRADGIP
jgi:hypothetical protein